MYYFLTKPIILNVAKYILTINLNIFIMSILRFTIFVRFTIKQTCNIYNYF